VIDEGLTSVGRAEFTQLAQRFADRVAQINAVVRVVALPLRDGLSIWTMLDGDTKGQARRAIYDAEFRVLKKNPYVPLEFRVVDAAEFPPERRKTLLPDGATLLYERDATVPGPRSVAPTTLAGSERSRATRH
jgi:hypothetical protein